MNAVSTIEREASPLALLNRQLQERTDSYRLALPSHIKPEDLQRTVVMAAQQNPTLLNADRRTLMTACMKAAQDGLLPDGRESALVPFGVRKKGEDGQWYTHMEVQYMPMVYGLRKKIMQSEQISSMQVGVVYLADYEAGRFLFDIGMEPPIRYKPDLTLPIEETADEKIIAAYSLVKFKDGSYSAEVMRRAEIDAIRELSQTGATKDRNGKARQSKGPWADHFGEMAKKTVMRRHSKVLPMSGDIFRDVEGAEVELAARSAVGVLDAVEPDAPLRLPSNDELDEQDGTTIDQATGEVTTDSRGFTEVDEETARALDAGEQTGEPDAEAEAADESEQSPLEAKLAEIRSDLAKAKTLEAIRKIDTEWLKHRAACDDATASQVDAEIRDRRKAVA